MYHLIDLYNNIIRKPLPTACGIACEIIDPDMAVLNRQLTERCSLYSFNLVLRGNAKVKYGEKEFEIGQNDLFISTPGIMVYTVDVSDDYYCLCLMGDEATTYEIPYARKIVTASYFPVSARCDSKLTLSASDAGVLELRLREIHSYINSSHLYKDECLYSLYSLFILDLLNIENKVKPYVDFNARSLDLFVRFLRLLSDNFVDHHDLEFYAGALSVTSIYLSRIVKRLSGQTVKNHVDRLLMMEACFRLTNTDSPVSEIAGNLNFANPASFCKFFVRQKGMSPREYRSEMVSQHSSEEHVENHHE